MAEERETSRKKWFFFVLRGESHHGIFLVKCFLLVFFLNMHWLSTSLNIAGIGFLFY